MSVRRLYTVEKERKVQVQAENESEALAEAEVIFRDVEDVRIRVTSVWIREA